MAKVPFQVIAEHSVGTLSEGANVLDLGCRGFLFTKALRELGHHVFSVDLDELHEGIAYYQCAVSNYDGRAGIIHTNDPQGTRIGGGDTVPCYTLETLTKQFIGEKIWDLVKMDIEGAEYQVILSMERPLAKQLSIEFHCHVGTTERQMREMENKLKNLGYKALSHKQTQQHGAGWNFWDSLFEL